MGLGEQKQLGGTESEEKFVSQMPMWFRGGHNFFNFILIVDTNADVPTIPGFAYLRAAPTPFL